MVGNLDSRPPVPARVRGAGPVEGPRGREVGAGPGGRAGRARSWSRRTRASRSIAIVASVVGGLPAAGVVAVFDARGSLLMAAIVFVVAGMLAFRIPAAGRPAPPETSEERPDVPKLSLSGLALPNSTNSFTVLNGLAAFTTMISGEADIACTGVNDFSVE